MGEPPGIYSNAISPAARSCRLVLEWPLRTGLRGSENLDFRKIAAVTGGIAGQESQAPDSGMRTDVEVRQR